MLYQIINETLIRQFPNYIEVDGVVYTNEIAREKARESGEWFDLVILDRPEYDEETEYLMKRYYQDGDTIYQDWDVYEKPEEDANVEDYEEALSELGVSE